MPETIVDIFGPVTYKLHLRRKGGLSRDGHIFPPLKVSCIHKGMYMLVGECELSLVCVNTYLYSVYGDLHVHIYLWYYCIVIM